MYLAQYCLLSELASIEISMAEPSCPQSACVDQTKDVLNTSPPSKRAASPLPSSINKVAKLEDVRQEKKNQENSRLSDSCLELLGLACLIRVTLQTEEQKVEVPGPAVTGLVLQMMDCLATLTGSKERLVVLLKAEEGTRVLEDVCRLACHPAWQSGLQKKVRLVLANLAELLKSGETADQEECQFEEKLKEVVSKLMVVKEMHDVGLGVEQ